MSDQQFQRYWTGQMLESIAKEGLDLEQGAKRFVILNIMSMTDNVARCVVVTSCYKNATKTYMRDHARSLMLDTSTKSVMM